MSESIPGPKGLPLIGNLLDVQDEVPIRAVERLADIYGPIFQLTLRGDQRIIVTSFELFDELCDETRFWKVPPKQLTQGRKGPPGLFGAPSEKDEDWIQAHRILMPAFSPIAIEAMFDGINPQTIPGACQLMSLHQKCTILRVN
jgi:cytochrome P450 / NADPH-cytochrome P450 reductase